jgi:hypothetical protein
MKLRLLTIIGAAMLAYGCATTVPITKSEAYKGLYDEKPITVLIMPPINRSTNVEAKEYFHSTLHTPMADAGYYVIPTFMSMEILKRESAYDAELFIDAPLQKFGEVFGADLAVFTIIHRWDKSGLAAKIYVEVEYIIKSTKTNQTVFSRRGNVYYNTAVSSGTGGLLGAVIDITASAINTAATKYINVARDCNAYTLKDIPTGKYSPTYLMDGTDIAGEKEFTIQLNPGYQ